MHPALGFRPFDEFCGYLPHFYKKCEDEKIPILAHCAPTGIITHEARLYKEFDERHRDGRQKNGDERHLMITRKMMNKPIDRNNILSNTYDGSDKIIMSDNMDYFFKTYGHPKNWLPVLKIFPDLHICFACFGGTGEWAHDAMQNWANNIPCKSSLNPWQKHPIDMTFTRKSGRDWIDTIIKFTWSYKNVYADISNINIYDDEIRLRFLDILNLINRKSKDNRYQHLKNKLIFGTGWYLKSKSHGVTDSSCGGYKAYQVIIHELFHNIEHIINEANTNRHADYRIELSNTVIRESNNLSEGAIEEIYRSRNAYLIDLISGGRLNQEEYSKDGYNVSLYGHPLSYWEVVHHRELISEAHTHIKGKPITNKINAERRLMQLWRRMQIINMKSEIKEILDYIDKLASETIANFASIAIVNPIHFEEMKIHLPDSYKIFLRMLR